jgi:acyl-CoA synthetase (AMP-forming)/AMP-acid ligase II
VQGACLGTRPIDAAGKAGDYVFETYAVVDKRVTDVSTGLILANLVPPALKLESGDRRVMGIFVKDMAEWVITEQACNRINAVVLPMYDTYTVENVTDVTEQVGLKTILTTADKLDRCIEVCNNVPAMDSVIVVVNALRRTYYTPQTQLPLSQPDPFSSSTRPHCHQVTPRLQWSSATPPPPRGSTSTCSPTSRPRELPRPAKPQRSHPSPTMSPRFATPLAQREVCASTY